MRQNMIDLLQVLLVNIKIDRIILNVDRIHNLLAHATNKFPPTTAQEDVCQRSFTNQARRLQVSARASVRNQEFRQQDVAFSNWVIDTAHYFQRATVRAIVN